MSENEAFGAALRAARQAKGSSIEDVAVFLKVSETIVRNIEVERFDVLPPRVFTRAFIRRYAELMGLDPDAMLWSYDHKTMPEPTEEIDTQPSATLPRQWTDAIAPVVAALMRELRRPARQFWVFGGTVVLIVAVSGLFLWLIWPSEIPGSLEPAGEASETVVGDARPTPTVPAVDSSPASADAPEDVSEPPLQQASVPVLDGLPGTSTDVTGEGDGEEEIPLSNPLTYVPGDTHQLFFRFTHDCWVVVSDGEGDLLHQDLENAGDELYVGGDPPFSITLGYAPGVRLEYNGEPVMLTQHTNDAVAKLVLGR